MSEDEEAFIEELTRQRAEDAEAFINDGSPSPSPGSPDYEELARQRAEDAYLFINDGSPSPSPGSPGYDYEELARQRAEDAYLLTIDGSPSPSPGSPDYEELARQRAEEPEAFINDGSPSPSPGSPDYTELARQRAEDAEAFINDGSPPPSPGSPDQDEVSDFGAWETVALFWHPAAENLMDKPAKRQKKANAPKCFLPLTVFKVQEGHYKQVAFLQIGDKVLSINGLELEIVHLSRHPPQKHTIVELRTRAASASFSASHRVAMEDFTVKAAEHVNVGDRVLVGSRGATVAKVLRREATTELFEVGFSPDEPVESFLVFRWGLASKGRDPERSTCDDGASVAMRSDDAELLSIPDTEFSYM